jgi:hypothetical protein
MAEAIRALGAVPVMGIFSTCNPQVAVRRLSGTWIFVQGQGTIDLMKELTGFDLIAYLKSRDKLLGPVVQMLKGEIQE